MILQGQLVLSLLGLLQLHHLLALLAHVVPLLLNELDLASQLYLGLTQVVKGLLLDLYQLDNLIHEHNRTDPVSAEYLINKEERAFVIAEAL